MLPYTGSSCIHDNRPPSARTDLELVTTFVAKAFMHDVKLTSLPIEYQVQTVLSVSLDLYKELLALKTFRPDLEQVSFESPDPHLESGGSFSSKDQILMLL